MRPWLSVFFLWLLVGNVFAASPKPPREVVINGVEFLHIPGGKFYYPVARRENRNKGFIMDNLQLKEIRAEVDAFYIAKYEARARDFSELLNTGRLASVNDYLPRAGSRGDGATEGCSVRRNDTGNFFLTRPADDLPATHLSWNLARDFAQAMGFRLPTNAEWTRAFRGDDRRMFPWGNEHPDDTFAAFQEGATQCHVQPVTGFAKGRSPYGVYNMAGNVFEFVQDWHNHPYTDSLADGVKNPVATEPWKAPWNDEPEKMLRGGRWASGVGEISMQANVDSFPPDQTFNCYGVRFAIDESEVRRHLAAGTARVVGE
jgi:iron(II)-dependent oxidoreductase